MCLRRKSHLTTNKGVWSTDTPPSEERRSETPQPPEEEIEKPERPTEKKIFHQIYDLRVSRKQLYKCFDAFANLAEKAGELSIKVEFESKDGVDPNWLRNAVEEPIEEAA